MKYSIRAVIAALVMSVLSLAARAVEATWNYAVQVTASVQASPSKITLTWTQDTTATPSSYTVYRKAAGASAWGAGTVLPGTTLTYTDTSVSTGTAYEYQVIRAAGGYSGYGYVQAGIDLPLVENRGKMILIVDNTMAAPLAAELSRLQDDLAGDGWTVIRHDVARTGTVTSVKSLIQSDYNADSANVKGVFLFGRIPVPYAGQLNPDGHPDHVGAWPADTFYGDMDGSWTDSSVNYTQSANTDPVDGARLTNRPGDGKFDQTTLPSAIELQVGRVDLANMPGKTSWNSPDTFPSETELLRQYLKKDHEYRHRIVNVQRRAIVGDYFGIRGGEAFAASGFRNFAPLVGSDQITNLNTQFNDQRGVEIPALVVGDYLFAYGCGAGSYKGISGLGNVGQYNDCDTVEMVSEDIHATFMLMFGSWFGDWDHEDSLLRAPLATKTNGLVSVWSGRPHWFIHPLGLGDTIGAAARLTQNNSGLYRNQLLNSANQVHAALMGDPSLRLYPVAPPASLGGTVAGSVATLTWAASPDSILGYYVYRAASATAPFTRLTPSLLTAATYVDASSPAGAVYMVRAVKKETSPSGSYYNASQGLFWKAGGATGPVVTVDTTAPTVAVATPIALAAITGSSVTLSANAADNVGVVGVQFLLDGNNLGAEATAAPYNFTWNSTTVANGPHTLSAIARDLAGNKTTATAVTVSVANSGTTTGAAWVDDALPAGASGSGTGGDAWTWVTASPAPFNGTKAHQTNVAAGLHEHTFSWASATMPVQTGDKLFAYVYLDPANVPSTIMISWSAGNWEHRAYWGTGDIKYGVEGTASRLRMGNIPATGQWVRLEVPASAVDLEGKTVTGMSFSLFGGKATWDYIGTSSATATIPTTPTTPTTPSSTYVPRISPIVVNLPTASTPSTTPTTPTASVLSSTAWFDDALPVGASGSGTGGDTWNWVTSSPAPFSGTKAHQSAIASGLHEHSFNWASAPMNVATGDTLYAYIYLDPANPPTEVMISWLADNWEHRAYWGADQINYGTTNTASRRKVGALPATGQWVRLEVPASQVGLEGQAVKGMSFSLFGGRATWDTTGTAVASSTASSGGSSAGGLPSVTLVASDASAAISSADNGAFTFTRTGSTTAPLKVKFALSGTAVKWTDYRRPEGDMPVEFTIPAGSASAVMNVVALGNATNSSPETAVVTLAADSAYAIGAEKSGTLTILATGSTGTGSTGTGTGSTGTGTGTGTGGTGTGTGGTGTGGTGTGGTGVGGTVDPAAAPVSIVDYTKLQTPAIGSNTLHVLSPTTLELVRINTAPAGGAVDSWNFVDSAGNFTAPASAKFNVTVNGQAVAVQAVGFKRRPLYAPLVVRDLRIASSLVLQLATPVADGQTVEVKNADGTLWPAAMTFQTVAQPVRYSPAIHVNQEGYVPALPKKAAVGYYLGNLGEMTVPNLTFSIVDVVTGAVAYSGTLVARPDSGWTYSPAPYQKVYEADFSSFATVGEYKLVVPGLGASLPFLVDDGIGMAFARTYAQGLYHQRCGLPNELPYTRFTHDACHTAPAAVPATASGYTFTWTTIASYANSLNADNPAQTAPRLTSPAAQLYPFVNTGAIDVSGGHHDAGDYSKYTINSATLLHTLMFAVDSMSGVAALDNLGLPESGDGLSDVMQEAKLEADYLAKLQDADGGFYFLVYPREREYENNVLPDRGDAQVVWPKNTAATAAAVAALAEAASSPKLKAAYPQAAAAYLTKAKAGWQFLTNAIAKYGKAGAYQKITHYGDDFTHDDELAWAAAAMFAATGDGSIHATLKSWYDPANPANRRWGWWHAYMGWGNALRTYAFAARSGRLAAGQLDAAYLAKCEAELRAAGDDALKWSTQSAYGTSFPEATKHVQGAGWYFSGAQSFDISVARQLDARADYLDAIVRNLNYEGGSNAVNVTYVTGLGWKRQKEIVHQYAQNDDRVLPPNGIPLGNVQVGPIYTGTYGTDLAALSFPRDNAATAPHGFYDRWSDTFNVTTEFVNLDQARALASFAYLAALTPAKSQAWKSATATITGLPATPALGSPITIGLQVAGLDLDGARILWEAKGQQPAYGETYTFTPGGYGAQWVEAEAQWPDGRRAVARATLFAENGLPTVNVAITDAIATIANPADTATWTFTRTGSTASAITVNFGFTGTAAKWTDYRRPEGDMPALVTIPAGATSATLTIRAVANSSNANPATVVLSLLDGTGYNIGTNYSATATLH